MSAARTAYEQAVTTAVATRNSTIDSSTQQRAGDYTAARQTYGYPNVTPANYGAFQAAMAGADANHAARVFGALQTHLASITAARSTWIASDGGEF